MSVIRAGGKREQCKSIFNCHTLVEPNISYNFIRNTGLDQSFFNGTAEPVLSVNNGYIMPGAPRGCTSTNFSGNRISLFAHIGKLQHLNGLTCPFARIERFGNARLILSDDCIRCIKYMTCRSEVFFQFKCLRVWKFF